MNTHLLNVAHWIWESSWQASLLAVAVLLLQKAFGKRLAPQWRYALWGLLALRLMLPHLPESRTSVYNVVTPAGNFAQTRLRSALGFQGDQEIARAIQIHTKQHISIPASAALGPTPATRHFPWTQALAFAWLTGATLLVIRSAFATYRFRQTLRRDAQNPSPEVEQILQEAATTLRLPAPRAIETKAITSPAVTGLLRPLLVLPPRLGKQFTPEEIRFLLLHELAHIRGGDLWTNFLAALLLSLHWFNPVLWLAFRHIRNDREAACDARVLATQNGEARTAYGHTLIKVLENLQPAAHPAGMVGILESKGQFRQRILQIADYVKPTRLASVGGGLLIVLVATTMLTRAQEKAGAGQSSPTPTNASYAKQPSYSDRLLAAARAGDGPLIQKITEESYKGGPSLGEEDTTELLDSLVRSRELQAFTVLLKEMRQTNLGKNWQPSDALLSGVVKDGRTDFLDAFLNERLDLKRLKNQEKNADPKTADWIARRVTEAQQQRDNIQKLVSACAKGDVPTVKQLLDSSVDVNCRSADGNSWTPLTRAASANKVQVVKLLLERGAQPDLPKFPGWDYTPLCLTSSVEIANLLKAAGANVHANLFRRKTSILTYVARWNGPEMVQWFLDQGLDPKMIGDNDRTLLFFLRDAKTAEILLKAGVDPNRPNEFGQLPIQTAQSGAVAEALIKGGAKVTGLKKPLLPGMVQFGSAEAMEVVLKAGAQQDHATLQSTLISVSQSGNEKMAEVLINHGANPNEEGDYSTQGDKMLPLMMCCIDGSAKVAKVLLAHGADPDAGNEPGEMLKTAIANKRKDVVEVLRQAHAKGASDLALALATGDKKRTAELLSSAPAYKEDPAFWEGALSAAAECGDLPTVKTALEKGVPVISDEGKEDGYYSAAFEGQWEVLDYLLHQRHPKDDPKKLAHALWGAVWNCHPYPQQRSAADFEKTVQLLLAAGAPPEPVFNAVFSRNPGGNARVIEMLVAAGADPNPELGKGKHLSDAIADTYKQKSCSTVDEKVVSTIERLAKVMIKRGK